MFRSRRASQTTRRAADGSLMKGVDRLGGERLVDDDWDWSGRKRRKKPACQPDTSTSIGIERGRRAVSDQIPAPGIHAGRSGVADDGPGREASWGLFLRAPISPAAPANWPVPAVLCSHML